MNLQYVTDHRGRRTGVFIPIEEWVKLVKRYNLPTGEDDKPELTKDPVVADSKETSINPEP